MAIVLGLDAKLLRGDAGATGATEVKNVKDLTLNLESGDADVTTRATGGWRGCSTVKAVMDQSASRPPPFPSVTKRAIGVLPKYAS